MEAKRHIRFDSDNFGFEVIVRVSKSNCGHHIYEEYWYTNDNGTIKMLRHSSVCMWRESAGEVASKILNEKIKDISWRKFGNNDYIHKNFLKY